MKLDSFCIHQNYPVPKVKQVKLFNIGEQKLEARLQIQFFSIHR